MNDEERTAEIYRRMREMLSRIHQALKTDGPLPNVDEIDALVREALTCGDEEGSKP